MGKLGFLRYKAFRAYQQMPEFVTRGAGVLCRALPRRLLLGTDFMKWVGFLEESQWWDEDEIQKYQNEQVRRLIAHAYDNVPFYRQEMDKRGTKPKNIETVADLGRLPIVNKQMMQQSPHAFLAKGWDTSRLDKKITGGSSGSPMHFYWPASAFIIERAFLWRYWNWAGYRFGDPAIRIRATHNVKNVRYHDAVQNMLEFYPTVLDENFVLMVAETAREFKPKALFGYPSYLHTLVNIVANLGLERAFKSVQVCFGASEKVFSEQRKAVESVIGAPLFEWYGMAELIASFGQCEKYRHMHDSPEHSYVEFLRPDGTPPKHGEQAMIVGTSFLNYAWPMIRYSIGDLAETTEERCSCGRKSRCVREIQGRCGDFILTPLGRLISPTSLNFAVDFVKNVLEYQVEQTELDHLEIRIVPGPKYEDSMGRFFAQEIMNRIGEPMKTTVNVVDKIDRPWSQKKRLIISRFGQKHFQEER